MRKLKMVLWSIFMLLAWPTHLYAQCSASFSADTASCSGVNVVFTSASQVSGNQYSWDFGDPSSGSANFDTLAQTAHSFSKSGVYTVTLIITRGSTCRDSVSQKVRIFKTPTVDFTFENTCKDLQSIFKSVIYADSTDPIQSYSWNLGNATSASTANVAVTYTGVQNYTVKLKVISKYGCIDSISKSIYIYDTPTASASLKEVCQNSTVGFTADTKTSATAYTFDFGDSSTFTQRIVNHVYSKAGWMQPQLIVKYPTTLCKIALDSILVNPLPDARFTILNDTQCFNYNNVCISLKHDFGVSKRSVSFDDGYISQVNNPIDTTVCHSYIDPDGGIYKITVELTDTNGCSATEFLDSAVLIHPILIARISNSAVLGCFGAHAVFQNGTNRDSADLKGVKWIWGDTADYDSMPFLFGKHKYEQDGVFYGRLIVEDKDGCWDTADAVNAVQNTQYPVDARIDTLIGYCHNYNQLRFSQTAIAGASIQWSVPQFYNTFSGSHSYNYPGVYVPTVLISKNGCDSSLTFDSVVIHGPVAQITNIINQFQCQITDTVYFSNGSISFRNKALSVFWDAQDPFGPKCIAPGKNNQNVWKNCNYSTDSSSFQHLYQKGKEDCYFAKLVVSDTALGCADSTIVALPLMAPNAKGNFTPSDTFACPGPNLATQNKTLTFDLSKPEPSCLKYAWWVMWDSLQATKSSNFDSLWVANSVGHNYDQLVPAGDSLGYVTVGLIVENGLDSNGKICRDTAWFAKVIKVTRIDARFSSNYNDSTHFCRGDTLHFALLDTQQNSGIRFIWSFGDGQSIDTVSQKPVFHAYSKGGSYWVSLVAIHPDGCRMEEGMWVHVGVLSQFSVSSTNLCIGGDSLELFQFNRYYTWGNPKTDNFNSTSRYQDGKEAVFFDINEGDGFQYYGENPKVKFQAPGYYAISMIVRDSMGCRDTLSNYIQVLVSGIYAGFTIPSDTFLCPQSIAFTSTASTYDSLNSKGVAGDFISSYEYTFGSKYPKSLFPNPSRFFETGTYRVVQKVRNQRGCMDSFVKNIAVIGPHASFDFLKDTVGCSPLRVDFKNLSTDANEYTWRFKDVNNNVLTTSSDSNVFLAYRGYGSFYPLLVARGTFTVNGVTRVCESVYPDTSIEVKREVRVLERPKANVVWATDCKTFTTSFYDVSSMNTGNINHFWASFGDGVDLGNGFDPTQQFGNIIHKYADTGTYDLIAQIIGTNGCADTFKAKVKISPPPVANFRWDPNCVGTATQFYDSTEAFNDYIQSYFWDFNDGSYASTRNPLKTYNNDRSYSVRLIVRNSAGCVKDTTKTVVIYSRPSVQFYANPVCHKDTSNFVQFTTAKQEIEAYDWDFADGNTSQEWAPKHLFAAPNNYLVKLRVKTIHGCWDSLSRWTFVDPNPVADIELMGDTIQCFTQHNFKLQDNSTISSGNTTAQWNFGDASTAWLKNVQKRFVDTGLYTIQLISISNYGCRNTTFQNVRVLPSVVPDFTIDNPQQCFRGNRFQFKNSSVLSGGTYDFIWEFGDGTDTLNAPAPIHVYSDTGKLLVRLRTITNLGCADTADRVIQLWPMPRAAFSLNDSDQCLSTNNVVLTNTSEIYWGNLSYNWDFGNGSNSVNVHAGVSYTDTGNFKVQLIAKSSLGCADTVVENVWIREMPSMAFEINDSSQCLNQNVFNFRSTSTANRGTVKNLWNFGDGNTSNQDVIKHSYTVDSEPIVRLYTETIYGCLDSIDRQVFVRPMPKVSIWVNDSQQCVNQQAFIFRDTGTIRYGSFNSYWRFKGDSVVLGKILEVRFPQDTLYQIRLISESNFGCMDSSEQRVQTWPKPFPDFSILDSAQCLRGNEFEFLQKGVINSGTMLHTWRFGDGSSIQTGSTQKHSYGTFGTFAVQLRSISDHFCVDSISKPIYVRSMPVAEFDVDDATQCLRGNAFAFTSSARVPTGTLRYFWDFGDGNQDTGKLGNHVYNNPDTFTVSHWILSEYECGDTLWQEVFIYPMPISKFLINDTGQCINQQAFNFEDISTITSGTLQRKWVFFDSSGTQQSFSRTFPNDIRYQIVLQEVSEFGCGDTSSQFITVFPKPNPAFTTNDSAQCLNQNFYTYTNESTIKYGSLSYAWDIGEFGEKYATQDANYFYSFWGEKQPLLIVTSDLGCVDSLRRKIKVNPMPTPLIGHNDSSQCFNTQNFVFWSKSKIEEGGLSHQWHLGDGNGSQLDSFGHYYAQDTFYDVKLIETSDQGCMDSATTFVVARPSPDIEFRINDTLQCLRQNRFETINYTRIKYGTTTGAWDFGDGTTSSDFEPVHVYNSHGVFTVSLNAISNHGCMDTQKQVVIVGAMPEMRYIVNDPGQCFPTQNFAFLNLSSIKSGVFSSKWKFGIDSIRVSDGDQLYKFAQVGDYPVTLIGISEFGCMDSVMQMISVNPTPQVRIAINDTDQCINAQNFIFEAESLIGRGKIRAYNWSLDENDLNTYNLQTVSKSYKQSGFKTIRLVNVSDSGCIDSAKRIIRVYPKPSALMLINDSAQCLFQNNYVFTDNSTDSLGILRRWWNINEEQKGIQNQISHVFGSPGLKNISLITESIWSCFDTSHREVYVKPMPDARFEVLREFYCQQSGSYPLNALRSGGAFFGKNVNNGAYEPKVLWRDTVTHVITEDGCTDSSKQYTQVYPQPYVDLGADTLLCKNEMLELQLKSWNSQYRWDDGSGRSQRRITMPGTYWVQASNMCGMIIDTVRIEFRDDNCRLYIPTAFTPTADALNDAYKPVGFDLDEMQYQIFNRWGQKVYEGNLNDAGWDGSYLGSEAPKGAYVLSVRYRYTTGNRVILGNDRVVFYLLR